MSDSSSGLGVLAGIIAALMAVYMLLKVVAEAIGNALSAAWHAAGVAAPTVLAAGLLWALARLVAKKCELSARQWLWSLTWGGTAAAGVIVWLGLFDASDVTCWNDVACAMSAALGAMLAYVGCYVGCIAVRRQVRVAQARDEASRFAARVSQMERQLGALQKQESSLMEQNVSLQPLLRDADEVKELTQQGMREVQPLYANSLGGDLASRQERLRHSSDEELRRTLREMRARIQVDSDDHEGVLHGGVALWHLLIAKGNGSEVRQRLDDIRQAFQDTQNQLVAVRENALRARNQAQAVEQECRQLAQQRVRWE